MLFQLPKINQPEYGSTSIPTKSTVHSIFVTEDQLQVGATKNKIMLRGPGPKLNTTEHTHDKKEQGQLGVV